MISCLLFLVLTGFAQGIVTWIFREFCPPTYTKHINVALHYLLAASYFILAYEALGLSLHAFAVAVLLRLALFDLAHNLGRSYMNRQAEPKRPIEPLFAVGSSSTTDRVLQWISGRLHLNASLVSAALRVAAVALLVVL